MLLDSCSLIETVQQSLRQTLYKYLHLLGLGLGLVPVWSHLLLFLSSHTLANSAHLGTENVATIKGRELLSFFVVFVILGKSVITFLNPVLVLLIFFFLSTILLCLGFIAVKRHHDKTNFYKGNHLIGAGLQVQRFIVHYQHGISIGNMQAGMLLEKELRVPSVSDGQVARSELT